MKPNRALRIESLSFTHPGGRDYNEDSLDECDAFGVVRLFMLADGAGGQGGGDVASRSAIEAARAAFLGFPVFSPDMLRLCMEKADEAICAKQKTASRLANMASTFVAMLVNDERGEAFVGNLGDSRCYVFRGGRIIVQSYDHSLVQRFVDAGMFPVEKLREHPRRNVLYASLGANSEKIPPFTTQEPIELQPGDGVMLCSDGVWELLDDATLVELATTSGTLLEWRNRLQSLVKTSMPPGHDNFSAILVKVYTSENHHETTSFE